jgi:uncharacterized membrane protein YoaK (UPF0700 family)
MTSYDRGSIALAAALSSLAGFVDAIGFLHLGGFFVSFMSGNSTRLGTSIARGNSHEALIAGGIIATFVVGVMLGSFCRHFAGARFGRSAVLVVQAVLLATGAWLMPHDLEPFATGAVCLAMGMENSVFVRGGEVSIGLTYMTGTLVKMGQRLAGAMLGGPRFAWLGYFALWLALALGAVAGALTFAELGTDGLWIASGLAAAFALVALAMGAREA